MADKPMPVFILGCVACGKTVSGTESKCPRCGVSFEDMRFECPFCGELIRSDIRRCNSCGTSFDVFAEDVVESTSVNLDSSDSTAPEPGSDDEPSEEVTYECPSCGKSVSESDEACPSCGARFVL
jgi:rubrerythrin